MNLLPGMDEQLAMIGERLVVSRALRRRRAGQVCECGGHCSLLVRALHLRAKR